jgi:hypothetical protein
MSFLVHRSVVLACAGVFASSASAFTITGGDVDTFANATSGKQGSSSGVVTDDPAPTPVTAGGLSASAATAVAGPVPPGQLSTLPGTSGISTGSATSIVDATVTDAIGISLSSSSSFASLDGGSYSANATASFAIDFTVDQPTEFDVLGTYNVDPGDILWQLRLLGGPGSFLINNATDTADAGDINESGVLQPGFDYRLIGNVGSNDSGTAPAGEFSTLAATFIVPEPASVALLAAGLGLVVLRRRD